MKFILLSIILIALGGCDSPQGSRYNDLKSLEYKDYIYKQKHWLSLNELDTLGIYTSNGEIVILNTYTTSQGEDMESFTRLKMGVSDDLLLQEFSMIYNVDLDSVFMEYLRNYEYSPQRPYFKELLFKENSTTHKIYRRVLPSKMILSPNREYFSTEFGLLKRYRDGDSLSLFDTGNKHDNLIINEINKFIEKDKHTYHNSKTLKIQKLTDNTFIHTTYLDTDNYGKVACNGMIVIDSEEALIIDTPTDDEVSEELINWVEKELRSKVVGVIATHFHVDCLGGLEAFHKRGIPSYANEETIYLAQTKNSTVPQKGFDQVLFSEVGDQIVVSKFLGAGHTVDNIVSYVQDDKVLFGGCLIKTIGSSKGNLDDADVSAWAESVRNVKEAFPGVELFVPGHGGHGGVELLDYTIEMFEQEESNQIDNPAINQTGSSTKSGQSDEMEIVSIVCKEQVYWSLQSRADSLTYFMMQALAESDSSMYWKGKFFCAFPNSFREMEELFGFVNDEPAPLYYSPEERLFEFERVYSNEIAFFITLNKSIAPKIYYDKYISININGNWQADNIGDAFQFHDEILKNPNSVIPVLLNYSDAEIKSVFTFIYDGPHPDNEYNDHIYHSLVKVLDSKSDRLSILMKESFEELMGKDHSH